jgi:transcription-repair coupling factor (superfamily II helicase)
MLYEQIKNRLETSEFIRNFDLLISDKTNRTLFYNLNRSAKSLLLARALQQTGKNIIFVTSDDKIAEEYLDDLDLLVGKDSSHFLPDYEVLPYEQRSPHYSLRAQRIETLANAVSRKPAIYCTSVRSFFRKSVPPEKFAANIINLKKNADYNPDVLISDLVGMGYENEFQVSKVGEVARRGGIIDVFSPGSHSPVRIEFFGDTVESIRTFSVSSQRSTGIDSESVTLIPSREFSLHDIVADEKMWEKVHNNGFYEGIESDISLLMESVCSFAEFFDPENCIIFWDEHQYFRSYFSEVLEETTSLYQQIISKFKKRKVPKPEDIFESEKFYQSLLRKYQNCFLGTSLQKFKGITYSEEAPFTPQQSFYGDLENLETELRHKIDSGINVLIQSDNRSQSKRMQELLSIPEIGYSIGVFQNGFELSDAKLAIYTDHEIFNRYKRKRRAAKFAQDEALVDYDSLKPGDYIVHIDHGIGIFEGLKKISIEGNIVECLSLKYAGNDRIYVPTYRLEYVSKFVSEEGIAPVIHKLGSKKWENSKSRAKKQIEIIAEDLVKLYAERKIRSGISFEKDNLWQQEMESSFIYEDTPDQYKTTEEIKKDMEKDAPMERLLCGDVGFGKTEVAIRAAFKAIMSGYQVAVLVPTTLLAEQHFIVFSERLAQYPIKVAMFSRFRSRTNLLKDVTRLASGEIDIAIGTHRLFSKDIKYKKLGLLIIDEEHRFGVRHKDKLRKIKSNVDTLYMSATPIPRTMYMALSKLKDLSLIRTSPKARLPIRTVIVPFDEEVVKDAISREVDRGGQVFFVHNRVQTIDSIAEKLKKLLPNVSFGIGHGQLPEKQLEAVTLDFAHHKFDVLIATTIIESGIDIPNANTIIVNRADMFGLAQLYQIRGRVGRSNRRAYAYFIIPPKFTDIARKRLETLTEYESLGSGYQIAMKDMEIRGAGTLLGTKQSGVINTIGFNFYNRLLDKAVTEIQSGNLQDLWDFEQNETTGRVSMIDDHFFPEDYIRDEKERLKIYKRMLKFSSDKEFSDLQKELEDRFGDIPEKGSTTLMFYKLMMFAKQIKLKSLKMKPKSFVMEFDEKHLPKRELLLKSADVTKLKISIEATKNLRITFSDEEQKNTPKNSLFDEAILLLNHFT